MTTAATSRASGFTLIELIVSVGLFAVVMMLASGSYLMMIALNRQAQALTSGTDNLAFALDSMTQAIIQGSNYCGTDLQQCVTSDPHGSFSFINVDGKVVTYAYDIDQNNNGYIKETVDGTPYPLTDPSIVISTLAFYMPADDSHFVSIIVKGTVNYGAGKSQPFDIETSAALRI